MLRHDFTPEVHIANEMLSTTFEQTGKRAAFRILNCARRLGELINHEWETDPILTVPFLRAGAAYACLPSMLAHVQGEGHTTELAEEVTTNLQTHYNRILNSELGDISYVRTREDYSDIKGCMSELAILGTLWWGTANRRRLTPDSYILPTTSQQDRAPIRDHRRTGVDLILGNNHGVQSRLQVKSDKDFDHGLPYLDDITVIEPRDLRRPPRGVQYNPYVTSCALMDAIVSKDGRRLGPAVARASEVIFGNRVARAA